MDVVVRGLMAAGMGIYGMLHALQALEPDAATWSRLAFAATALAAAVLLVGLVAAPSRLAVRVEPLAALLAASSAVALVLTLTVGFFGVEDVLRPSVVMVLVAEVVVVASWLLLLRMPADTSEKTDDVADVDEIVAGERPAG